MLDERLPDPLLSGRDDLYALLRETRAKVNDLEKRIESMANTQGNSSMRPNRMGRPKGSKNK